jgi:hypothetical protein
VSEEALFRDEDGSIILVRLPGDRWNVIRTQTEADWIRRTEGSGPFKGQCGDDRSVAFIRVQPVDEADPHAESGEVGGDGE